MKAIAMLLDEYGILRQDWVNQQTLEILDPDLSPCFYNKKTFGYFDNLDDLNLDKNSTVRRFVYSQPIILFGKVYTIIPDHLKIRNSYTWTPTDFQISGGKVKLNGPLAGFPVKGNYEAYKMIAGIFSAMIPALKKLYLISDESNSTTLQVVVEVKKIILEPGQTYEYSKWCLEGKTESIAATGFYTCQLSKSIERSSPKIEFKGLVNRLKNPNPLYQDPVQSVDIQEGSCVVYANNVVNRISDLTNTSDNEIGTAMFIKYYMLNPGKLYYSESKKLFYWKLLKAKKLKKWMIENILRFLVPQSLGREKALQLRAKVREGLSQELSGWGIKQETEEFYDGFHRMFTPSYFDKLDLD